MPFGLKNAAQAFQRLMDTVTQGLEFVFVYLDDILTASANQEEHLEHLKILFERLRDHGLVINPSECEFGVNQLNFLGHVGNRYGVSPLPDKVESFRHFSKPATRKGLQEFVVMVNFHHRFISNHPSCVPFIKH